ncbi:M28 family peptidase, partial [candidate division KSB1 bacterium]
INPFKKINPDIVPCHIPVIFAGEKIAKYLQKKKEISCSLTVNIKRNSLKAFNVAGYINNNATSTILIGAHYDHLGLGPESPEKSRFVFNGADDNASGIAGLIELARFIKSSNSWNSNYLFLAFSGEEKGFLGSKFFIESNAIKLSSLKCMLNMDMIGRLDSLSKTFYIVGAGSSQKWEYLINKTPNKQLLIAPSNIGIGGSDHYPFNLNGIPNLFFFTGLHKDYHTPYDDIEKINFKGTVDILDFIKGFIQIIDTVKEIPYQTISSKTSHHGSSNIILGIIPDQSFKDMGIKIADIINNLPAYNAGIKSGDIIIKVDENEIVDFKHLTKIIQDYKHGAEIKMLIVRNDEEIIKTVFFQ